MKLLFLHSPRTGGQYVGRTKPIENIIYYGHVYVVDNIHNHQKNPFCVDNNHVGLHGILPREKIKDKIVFSIVRNPFDLLVSIYHHWWYNKTAHSGGIEITNATFEEFIKAKFYGVDEYRWSNSKRFLFPAVFSDGGDFICDWICRTETLDEDLEALADYYNLKYNKKNRINQSNNRMAYQNYYNSELVECVNTLFNRELDIYGYEFGSLTFKNSNLYRHIPEKVKANYKYIYSTDKYDTF